MSPTKKTVARKKPTKKAPGKKAPAKKAAKKPARKAAAKKVAKKAAKSAAKKAGARKATKAPAKKASARKATKASAKKASAKKATKASAKKAAKKATKKAAKKAGKKGAAKAAEAAPPAKPKKPGNLIVARGKQVSKLGDRWTCWGCGAVFYDLNQPKAICPKCGQDQSAKQAVVEEKKKPAKRDSMRALRVLDDDDGPANSADSDSGEVEMDLEMGTSEKLLEQADKVDTDDD